MLTGAQLLSVTQPRDSVTLFFFGINVQDSIKYLPFGIVLHCFLHRQGRNFTNIYQKSALYDVTAKCRDYFEHS